MSLIRFSSGQQVARELRDALLRGEIAPGARLHEVSIAEMYGVSRNTVREALRLLEKEGLVSHTLHRGVVVIELSEAEIREVYRARWALEVAGILLSADAPATWLTQLNELAVGIAKSRSPDELANADLAFHAHIVAAIGSRRLAEQYQNIQAQLRLTRAWTVRQRAEAGQSYELHQEIVESLAAADLDLACRLVANLNAEGERRLREAIRHRPRDDGASNVWPAPDSASWRTPATDEPTLAVVASELTRTD